MTSTSARSAISPGANCGGRLRFGTSEDFALSQLPEVLREFRQRHPAVDVELTVSLSGDLHRKLESGKLDLFLAKRQRGVPGGKVVWRDKLVWVGREGWQPDPDRPLPLVTFPPPSISHTAAMEALDRERRALADRVHERIAQRASGRGHGRSRRRHPGADAHRRGTDRESLATPAFQSSGSTEFVILTADKNPRSPAAALSSALIANANRFRTL